MKIYTYFALKNGYKNLQTVRDKVAEIDSLIDWKSFRIICESLYLTKKSHEADLKLKKLLCLKFLFYSKDIVFTILNLRNNVFIEFISENPKQ
jgi:hypothetical protein